MTEVQTWLYALACVLVPVAWGVLVVRVTGRVESWIGDRFRRGKEDRPDLPPLEYHL
ncbi:MAG: hypothetical protein KY468_05385 [Armatimonadetes bacterium]|nr:hypothetical protein [Armatimonadota bacterium]